MDSKSEIDLTGKLIIKVQLENDIRRIPIHNEAITYDELVLMMQRVFRGKLTAYDDITIKYRDEDGDLITIFDSSDLSFAIQCSRILKLQIILNNKKENKLKILSHGDINNIKQQLRNIRNEVNSILENLDDSVSKSVSTTSETKNTESATKDAQPPVNPLNKVNPSEFDPLQENKNQKNGNALEAPKENAKNSASNMSNSEKPVSRPQSVPSMQRVNEPVAVSAASSASQQLSDYYNRNPPTSYGQIPYASVPYPPQHYAYSAAGYTQQVDSQVPNSGTYTSPPQGGLPYSGQPQQYNNPGLYQAGQPNPYSKTYSQPSSQHFLPPRQ
ncbi:protein TFG-like isoform X2 [Coccinella septempunctata]|uniref:protein TFG-like isoform X2 n=1 Tax=Coccinella septempunctata TaxID=41139 RepID=UPI001D091053|nr:protein TFG-like isoform X2 [Coccinella septempunctata]